MEKADRLMDPRLTRTTHGRCLRCGVKTVRFHADEERFEVETDIAHTPRRCERIRTEGRTAQERFDRKGLPRGLAY